MEQKIEDEVSHKKKSNRQKNTRYNEFMSQESAQLLDYLQSIDQSSLLQTPALLIRDRSSTHLQKDDFIRNHGKYLGN